MFNSSSWQLNGHLQLWANHCFHALAVLGGCVTSSGQWNLRATVWRGAFWESFHFPFWVYSHPFSFYLSWMKSTWLELQQAYCNCEAMYPDTKGKRITERPKLTFWEPKLMLETTYSSALFCEKDRPIFLQATSVQFSRSVVSDSLWPHGLQHTRLPSPSPTPRACSNSCPSSQWCHPTISSSVTPLLLLPLIFPSIRVFFNESVLHIRWLKYWSFSFSISPSSECSGLVAFKIYWFESPLDCKEIKPVRLLTDA